MAVFQEEFKTYWLKGLCTLKWTRLNSEKTKAEGRQIEKQQRGMVLTWKS